MLNYLDALRKKVAYRTAKFLAKTRVTPNQITVARFLVAAPASAYFFSRGQYLYNLVGLAIYVPLAIVDWVDGDLARLTGRSSALGKFLDDTLDHILVLVVLGSVFYGGMSVGEVRLWGLLALLFFTAYFFLTVLMVDFDELFGLDFASYPQIEERLSSVDRVGVIDRLLLNLLNVHRSSWSKFLFCTSYPLFVGIIVNQLLLTFIFITAMIGLRSMGVAFIMYRVLRKGPTASALTKVLRGYLNHNE